MLKTKGKVIFEDLAVGDFRLLQYKTKIEKDTIEKKNKILCHFFTREEIMILFKEFSTIKIQEQAFQPIINNKKLERRLISGIIIK